MNLLLADCFADSYLASQNALCVGFAKLFLLLIFILRRCLSFGFAKRSLRWSLRSFFNDSISFSFAIHDLRGVCEAFLMTEVHFHSQTLYARVFAKKFIVLSAFPAAFEKFLAACHTDGHLTTHKIHSHFAAFLRFAIVFP